MLEILQQKERKIKLPRVRGLRGRRLTPDKQKFAVPKRDGKFQRVEKVSTRWQRSKKVGRFFVFAFVGVRGYARVQKRKKQESTRHSRWMPCAYFLRVSF